MCAGWCRNVAHIEGKTMTDTERIAALEASLLAAVQAIEDQQKAIDALTAIVVDLRRYVDGLSKR
jgi:hypothetical protein